MSGSDEPYSLTSDSFEVTPWTGVVAGDGRVDENGDVSFTIADSAYPRTWSDRDTDAEQAALDAAAEPAAFRTIRDDKNNGGRSKLCRTCSFRPWAETASPVSAVVTVTRADGTVEQIPAALAGGRWVADTSLLAGDTAVVAAGGVRDAYGETNGTALTLR